LIFKNFTLTTKFYTSPASRKITFFPSESLIADKFKNLTTRFKNLAGRSPRGRIIFRTKTSLLFKKKSTRINYSLRFKRLGTIASFSFIPYKNKLLSLIFFSNGSVSYFLSTDSHVLFSFFYSNCEKKLKKIKMKSTHFMLFQIKKLSFISFLEITPGSCAQYVRSSGTKARLIAFDKTQHTCLLQLPSGVKKIFSYYSFALLGPLSISFHKKRLNGKAGFWRKFGRKPIVRGVAMNAVDHPHGGRTKSVKNQRTPWGKITKRK